MKGLLTGDIVCKWCSRLLLAYPGVKKSGKGTLKAKFIASLFKSSSTCKALHASTRPCTLHTMLNRQPFSMCIVLSILLYGCETWSISHSHVSRLKGFQMRCLTQFAVRSAPLSIVSPMKQIFAQWMSNAVH